MSIVAAVDEDNEWVVLTDSAVDYNGVIRIEPQTKGYILGEKFGLFPVGNLNESEVWKRTIDEMYMKGGPKATGSQDIIWELMKATRDLGNELTDDFPVGQTMFMKVTNHLFYVEGPYIRPINQEYMAIGSGRKYFYGAMDAGGQPVAAMKSACLRDPYCAKPIVEYHINKITGEVQRFE